MFHGVTRYYIIIQSWQFICCSFSTFLSFLYYYFEPFQILNWLQLLQSVHFFLHNKHLFFIFRLTDLQCTYRFPLSLLSLLPFPVYISFLFLTSHQSLETSVNASKPTVVGIVSRPTFLYDECFVWIVLSSNVNFTWTVRQRIWNTKREKEGKRMCHSIELGKL